MNVKRALIAVHDKRGVADFARALVDEFGVEIVSTGGTAKHLQEAGVPVTLVEALTGSPELLDGRVKTLHPKIHAAILADRDNPEHLRQLAEQEIEPIDMVVVNLYPFEETIAKSDCTFEDAIEMIDIGGPCLLRAAAKNHKHVLAVSDPAQYGQVLGSLHRPSDSPAREHHLRVDAAGAFMMTAAYDGTITQWLTRDPIDGRPRHVVIPLCESESLRYGENPHQSAQLHQRLDDPGRLDLTCADLESSVLPMSYNNYLDADAALQLCREITRELTESPCACVFMKHSNPSGVGVADRPNDAYRRAYLGDPNAAMGGVLACNFRVRRDFAETVMGTYSRWGRRTDAGGFFLEVWIAPTFDESAVEVIQTKKSWGERVRLMAVDDMGAAPDPGVQQLRSVTGGVLMQSTDLAGIERPQWEVVTQHRPAEREMHDLRLAWLICKHTKSNAVTLCRDGMLIGNGAGQSSRVMSCRIATWLAAENGHLMSHEPGRDREGAQPNRHRRRAEGRNAVAASDAFFPFRDGPDLLLDAGVTAIIQPGGSKRDADVIAACHERGAAMIFTHTRHFRH